MGRAGEGLKGAAGGAMTGAAIGSVVPGVGTAIGAGIGALGGGLLGAFGGGEDDEQKRLLEEYRKQIMGRQAPQLGPASLASTSGFRTNQQNLIGRLEAMAGGQGPSLVAEQARQNMDRNQAAASSVAQSGRGNPTLANLVAANNVGNFNQASAGQAAVGRVAEQQMALGQLGGAVQAGRGADDEQSRFNALQQNYNAQSNLEAKLRTMGLNDQAILAVMGQVNQINQAPTTGDALLAGGAGSLGMFAGQMGGAGAMGNAGGPYGNNLMPLRAA